MNYHNRYTLREFLQASRAGLQHGVPGGSWQQRLMAALHEMPQHDRPEDWSVAAPYMALAAGVVAGIAIFTGWQTLSGLVSELQFTHAFQAIGVPLDIYSFL